MAKRKIVRRKKRVVVRPSWKTRYKELEEKNDSLEEQLQLQKFNAYRWQSANGPIAPADMDEEHLRNTINFLVRRVAKESLQVVYTSSMHGWFTGLHHMMDEAKKRGFQF